MLVNIPPQFIRSAITDEEETVVGAVELLGQLAEVLGRDDLGDVDLLDIGCGVKFTQAIQNNEIPIGTYTGVDVFRDMVEFLQEHVQDERFTFSSLDVENELYNPGAPKLTSATDLGLGAERYDLITLYSVFTHLNPADYVAMLHVTRRYVRETGHLVFTAFLDEPTDEGHSLTDFLVQVVMQQMKERGEAVPSIEEIRANRPILPFLDADPSMPLTYAMYSIEHAHELMEGTGWRVDAVHPPTALRQHLFVCSPR